MKSSRGVLRRVAAFFRRRKKREHDRSIYPMY